MTLCFRITTETPVRINPASASSIFYVYAANAGVAHETFLRFLEDSSIPVPRMGKVEQCSLPVTEFYDNRPSGRPEFSLDKKKNGVEKP